MTNLDRPCALCAHISFIPCAGADENLTVKLRDARNRVSMEKARRS
jgi:hypothetical protein